jgi:hypothetical protein
MHYTYDLAVASATAVFELRKAGGLRHVTHPDGGHDFSDAAQAEAYGWLEPQLKR